MNVETVEVRWFSPASTAVRPGVLQQAINPTTRTDWYAPSDTRSGIKLREGNLESKILLRNHGSRDIAGVVGRIQSWRKWVYSSSGAEQPSGSVLADADWIAVTKRRWLLPFGFDHGVPVRTETWPASGCHFEWTEISVRGTSWLTVGFEAFGTDIDLDGALLSTAGIVIPHLPADLALGVSNSSSYPEWLASLRAAMGRSL